MKRVTSEQAKRIIDFLSGTVYAIGGDLQKIGSGIFLCTPKNVNVEGTISDEDNSKKQQYADNGYPKLCCRNAIINNYSHSIFNRYNHHFYCY